MYVIKIRPQGKWFFKTLKVLDHNYLAKQDKTIFHLSNGCYYEMPGISKCEMIIPPATALVLQEKAKANDNVSKPQEPDHK